MTWTALHHLCGLKTSPSNIDEIATHSLSHPDDISEVDDHGFTPLHVEVIRSDPREEVIRAFLQANPNAVLNKVTIVMIKFAYYAMPLVFD